MDCICAAAQRKTTHTYECLRQQRTDMERRSTILAGVADILRRAYPSGEHHPSRSHDLHVAQEILNYSKTKGGY